MTAAIVWFRNDLRLADNPALRAAVESGLPVVPVYIHDPQGDGHARAGAASDAWRARSLQALDDALRARGNGLRLFAGQPLDVLGALAASLGAHAVFWNRRYEPDIERRDAAVKSELRAQGLRAESFNGALLFEPWELRTGKGGPYRVYTPFWRAARSRWALESTSAAPDFLRATDDGPHGVELAHLRLAPQRGWDAAFWHEWRPGEDGAHAALEAFTDGALRAYAVDRDRPDRTGTSRLSPHLHFGEIAPWRVAAEVERMRGGIPDAQIDAFLRQLVWREFAVHLLHHFPHTAEHNLDARFDGFNWAQPDRAALERWRHGRTGVPIIDAGMRELWHTGWMHNRVRMIVASYLCKHMRVHWRTGAQWFAETLVDADLANNVMGWQWVAGTGADAAPYFRVFNPVTQALRFDPKGQYVARWLPELAELPVALRHSPWSDVAALRAVTRDYPVKPLVELSAGRDAALLAYRTMRAAARDAVEDRSDP